MPAGAAENRQATTQAASTVSTKALTVQVPSGASITINGRDVGLNPADGYDPNPSDNDISTMKVIGTGAGTTELKNLPAGWYVSTQTWNWQGQNGIRYHVWSGSTNYNWFLSGATNFKHCVYELRSLDYFRFGDESNLLTGYDWSQNQTLHGYIENAQPGWHIVAGWSGGGQPLSDRYRYQWTADDDPSLTITHDFMYDSGEAPADWSKLMAWLPDGSPVTGFNPNGSSNKIPTDTKSVTWTGIPDGWNVSDTRVRTDRIVTDFSKTGQADRTVILFYSDDYEPTYTADQLKKLTATTDTGDTINGFDPVNGGTFPVPAGTKQVSLNNIPDGWTATPLDEGIGYTLTASNGLTVTYTFDVQPYTQMTADELAALAKYQWKSADSTVQATANDTDTLEGHPTDWTLVWSGTGTNPLTEDPDAGWYDSKGNKVKASSLDAYEYRMKVTGPTSGVSATFTLHTSLQNEPIIHNVSFDMKGGSPQERTKRVIDGKTVAQPADPTREGYRFAGWLSNGKPYDFSTPVTSNIVLTASWTAIDEHAIIFDSAGGSFVPAQTVEDGETGTQPEPPTREGYTFKGWLLDGQPYDFTQPVTGDITLTADWELSVPDRHTVTFDTKGGSAVSPITVKDGNTIAKPMTPTRKGYEFKGWLLNGKPYDFTTPVTSDITLIADWEKAGTTKPSYGIDDLKDLGFLVDGKPYKPFDPNTHEYRLGDGEHTVKIGKGTISADWRIMSDTVRQPDGTNKIGYSLTSPDGSFTVSYTFAWNEKAPEYTADDLKHVSATINGKPVNGFNPTHDGSYTVPDGSTVKIEGLPSEWRMTEDHDPAQPSMWLRYTITSPDSNVKVSYTFTSDKKGETTKPETGDTNQTDLGKGVDGTIANTVDSQLSSTGIGITRPLILAVPLLLAGIVIAVWPSLRRKRIR